MVVSPSGESIHIFFTLSISAPSSTPRSTGRNIKDTLSKDLPRIPFSFHFEEFEKAGEKLRGFHVRYEQASKCENVLQVGELEGEISKMRLDKDRGVLAVNRYLSFRNIPRGPSSTL